MEEKKANGKATSLNYGKLVEGGQRSFVFEADIPAGTRLEELLAPHYWRHYAAQLSPMNIIEAMCEDGSWEASLRVMFASKAEVKCVVRWSVQYSAEDATGPHSETHKVAWRGPTAKWSVVRKDTGEVIKKGLYPESAAHAFLKTHLQSLQQ